MNRAAHRALNARLNSRRRGGEGGESAAAISREVSGKEVLLCDDAVFLQSSFYLAASIRLRPRPRRQTLPPTAAAFGAARMDCPKTSRNLWRRLRTVICG